jgi:parallel beta-helix repeat protein
MTRKRLRPAAFAFCWPCAVRHQGQQGGQTVALRPGLSSQSVRITPGVYRLPASASLDSPHHRPRRQHQRRFCGCDAAGIDIGADPDQARGLAILVEGGRNVTIRNARVRGYHIGLRARGTRGLVLQDNNFSYNWKPRLFSVVEHESLVDWLSHHRNDNSEWLRFGAGVYLESVRGGEIRGNRIEQGMEGLMLVRSDSLRIWNNTIEYNSGVGIGLYRSSYNTIMHNHASYNVRGYSHGFPPGPGFRRSAALRAEQPQHRGVQLDDARRGWSLSLGRSIHDGHGAGWRERQPVLRE